MQQVISKTEHKLPDMAKIEGAGVGSVAKSKISPDSIVHTHFDEGIKALIKPLPKGTTLLHMRDI